MYLLYRRLETGSPAYANVRTTPPEAHKLMLPLASHRPDHRSLFLALGSLEGHGMDGSADVTPLFPSRSRLNRSHQNHLIARLPLADRERLINRCERVTGRSRDVVYRQHGAITHVYFPLTGVVSLVLTGGDADSIEAGMVGNEGLVGLPGFFGSWISPTNAVWQVGGESYRMGAEAFQEEVGVNGLLRSLLGRYAQAGINHAMQSLLCNNFHPVEQRLCRWLLMTHDRVGADELPLTQEFIAHMLGIRRPSVTVAAGMLQSAGMITYRRGLIRVLDRPSIEKGACECYEAVKRDFETLLLPGT
jgi:CRP-like cAMP-binding protein